MHKINRFNIFTHLITAAFLMMFGTIPTFAGGVSCIGGQVEPAPMLSELLNYKLSKDFNLPKGLDNTALLNMESGGTAFQESFDSAFKIGGSKVTQIGATAKDTEGNFYVTGGYTGTIDFGTSSITSSGGYDFFIAKFDAAGNNIWYKTAKGDTTLSESFALEGGIAITVDKSGDCYVGGSFVKLMSFLDNSGNVIAELTDGKSDSKINFEMFVAKYSSSGTLLWAKGGNSGSDGKSDTLNTGMNYVTDIILDGEDYPYIGGSYSGSDFLGEDVNTTGKSDFYIASLDKMTGDPLWVKLVGTPDEDGLLSLSVDSLGYINAIGRIGKGDVILPDTNEVLYTNNTGAEDTFVIGFDVNGKWYFSSFVGGSESVVGNDIASDVKGNIFVIGNFTGNIGFEGSDIELNTTENVVDGLIIRFDLNANPLWARSFGGGISTIGSRVVADEDGNCIIVGTFEQSVTFEKESSNPFTLVSEGLSDMFVAKYDSSGNFLWATKINGSGSESLDLIESSTVSAITNPVQLSYGNKRLIISGDFNNTLSLGNITLDAGENNRSGFIATFDVSNITTGIKGEQIDLNLNPEFTLSQNYPNPFNPTTTLNFSLPNEGNVKINIYNSIGQKVETLVNAKMSNGNHQVVWDASGMASGLFVIFFPIIFRFRFIFLHFTIRSIQRNKKDDAFEIT